MTLAVENLVYGAALMANAPDVELTSRQQAAYAELTTLRGPHKIPMTDSRSASPHWPKGYGNSVPGPPRTAQTPQADPEIRTRGSALSERAKPEDLHGPLARAPHLDFSRCADSELGACGIRRSGTLR